jgi:hypothetical protein
VSPPMVLRLWLWSMARQCKNEAVISYNVVFMNGDDGFIHYAMSVLAVASIAAMVLGLI